MSIRASLGTLLVLAFVLFGFLNSNKVQAKVPADKSAASDALEQRRLDIEERKVALENDKLTHEKEKDAQNLELETQKARWTAYSISLPLFLGVLAYGLQIGLQRRTEKSQFKLKAAEIAMSARDSNQVQAKGAILKALFRKELKSFNPKTDFTPSQYPYSQSIESREALIALLAENPTSRKEIILAWAAVFPWDWDPKWNEGDEQTKQEYRKSYKWFVKLKEDLNVNSNSPAQPPPDQSSPAPQT